MDDINFEELDKAVNSVLQKDTSKPKPTTDVAQDDQQEPEPAMNESEASQSVSKDEEPETPVAPRIVPPKRRGQFMDIVHPSSDMKASSTAPRPLVPNRQAATVQPLDPGIVETSVDADTEAPKADTPKVPEGPAETLEHEVSVKPEWPDPLDMPQGKDSEETTEPEAIGSTEAEAVAGVENGFATDGEDLPAVPEVIDETEKPANQETEEPRDNNEGDTPFIRTTEVEKRPLGAFAGAPLETENSGDVGNEPEVSLPQELAPEVVSVEADGTGDVGVADSSESHNEGSAVELKTPPRIADAEDGPGHPVFDTKDYHQPLTPPSKKSHTGRIVLLIVLLLAAAAAAGWYIATSMGVI